MQENDRSNRSRVSGFFKPVLSRRATTADAEKCIGGNSAQPLAAHPAHTASDKQTPPPKTEGDCPT